MEVYIGFLLILAAQAFCLWLGYHKLWHKLDIIQRNAEESLRILFHHVKLGSEREAKKRRPNNES